MLYHFLLDSMVSDEKSIILWHECQVFSYTPTSLWGSIHIFYSLVFLLFILGNFYCSIFKFTDYFLLLPSFCCWAHHWVFILFIVSFNSKISTWFFMFSISLLRFSVFFFHLFKACSWLLFKAFLWWPL